MPASRVLPLLVVLLGPTASGKTSLSLRLAREFNGEIVSCDSVAVYRDFEIGTAKPSVEERLLVRHHLIDVVWPGEIYSAGRYSRDGRMALAEIRGRGHLPIVTGGTGLYLRALLNGLFASPARSEELRERLQRMEAERTGGHGSGAGRLHRILMRLDPAAGAAIHPNDLPKLIRAIEIRLVAGKRITDAWTEAETEPLTGFRVLRIGLEPDRQELYGRINQRASAMFAQGLVGETRMLMEKYRPELKLFDALGYRQAAEHLRGESTLEAAMEQARQGHRNYAKRQMTWFRREPEVVWLRGFGDDEAIAEAAARLVRQSI